MGQSETHQMLVQFEVWFPSWLWCRHWRGCPSGCQQHSPSCSWLKRDDQCRDLLPRCTLRYTVLSHKRRVRNRGGMQRERFWNECRASNRPFSSSWELRKCEPTVLLSQKPTSPMDLIQYDTSVVFLKQIIVLITLSSPFLWFEAWILSYESVPTESADVHK